MVLPKLKRHLNAENTLSDHDSIHWHRNLNDTERSAIARHRNFNAPKICKITVVVVLTAYEVEPVPADGWFCKIFHSTDPWNTDRPTHENLRKKLSNFGRKLHVLQRKVAVKLEFERQCLVCLLEQGDFNDPGIEVLIGEEWFRISVTRRAKILSEVGAGIPWCPIKS